MPNFFKPSFSKNVLSTEEQEFNQVVLYGKDIETAQIIAEAKQFPFGSEKRVVIIKEAQHLTNIEILDSYLDTVQPSTILVICYKGKSVDKRKKFGKTLSSKCVVFESKKLYDNKIPAWINSYITENGFKIDNSATAVLAEYIGADLSKITYKRKFFKLLFGSFGFLKFPAPTLEFSKNGIKGHLFYY